MKILVDADACPVKQIVVAVAKKYRIEVHMFIDTSHVLDDGYSKITVVDKASDSADFAIINNCAPGDITVTQDYGLAAMLISKKVHVINQNGFIYDNSNIDRLLLQRHISKELRRAGMRGSHNPPRQKKDNLQFENTFERLVQSLAK